MEDKNWLAEGVHYVVLALAVWFVFGWLMTTPDYEFTEPMLFIILLLVIIIVDMILHKILEKWLD